MSIRAIHRIVTGLAYMAIVLVLGFPALADPTADISVSPTSFSESLFTGGSVIRTLRLTNTGESELNFDLTVRGAALAAEGVGTPVAVLAGTYSGVALQFGITDYGEVMPFQYPVGNEDLAVGGWYSGYTVAYVAGGSDHLCYAQTSQRFGITPISYTEIRNTPEIAEIEVVTRTSDGILKITQHFVFSKATRYFTVTAEIANLLNAPVSSVVFKRTADWDVDADYPDDSWDYDIGRNMVLAWDQTYVAMAGVETALFMDIDGWDDLYSRDTIVEIPAGPVTGFDGLEVLHFDLGTLGPAESKTLHAVYGAGSSLAELRQAIDQGRALATWLSFDLTTGTVPAGGYQDILVTFDATGLNGGDYDAQIVVTSNDPDESEVTVPAHMHVTGVADIEVAPEALHYGSVFVGVSSTRTISVANVGTDVLTVTRVAADHGDFSADVSSFTLGIGEMRDITVTYGPSGPGPVGATLTIESDDPDEPAAVVSLSGEGLIPPDVSVTPASLSESLFTGGSVTRTVTIANTGGSDLSFAVAIENGAAITHAAAGQLPAGTRSDVAPTTGIAAPMVVESRMAGADVLLLQDVAPWGTNSNQQVLAANGLAFDMIGSGSLAGTDLSRYRLLIVASDQPSSFYSALATQLNRIEAWVVSGGVLEFHAASMGWQDGDTSTLTLPRGMHVYQRHIDVNYVLDPTHPVVAGVSSVIYGTQASHTSFADIPADASLVVSDDVGQPNLVVYRDGLGLVVAGGQTFEFALAAGQDAGQILINMIPYAHGLQPRWLLVDSPGGVVPAGGSVDLSVTFDATGLNGGDYDAQIVVTSNDPDESEVTVPAHLQVTGVADIEVTPEALDYGSVFVGVSSTRTISVANAGTDVLTVTRVAADHGDFASDTSSFTLGIGETRDITVTYGPSGPGPVGATLTIESDDPDEPVAVVSLSGEGLIPPDVSVTPTSLSESLFTGGSVTRTLTITNAGGSDLNFQIGVLPASPAASASVGAVRAPNLKKMQLPVSSAAVGRYDAGRTPVRAPLIPVGAPGTAGNLAILILHSGSDINEIRALLQSFADIAVVDVFDAQYQVPSLAQLTPYRSVIVVGNFPFSNPIGVGDVLADYVDGGGGVVLTVPTYVQGWSVAGRFVSDGYLPVVDAYGPAGSSTLGSFDAAHPIMRGVSSAWGDLLATGTLAEGAELVASWSNGLPFVATKGLHVTAINVFVGASGYWAGDIPLILHNAAFWSTGVRWLSVGADSGVVPAGGSVELSVTFDATGLNGGEYDAQIVVTSNDPDESEVAVPAHMHVTGVADIEVTPEALDYGPVFVGVSSTRTISVANAGTDVLTVTRVAADHGDFSADVSSFTLGIGEMRDITVAYGPSGPGPVNATLTIESDDPDEPAAVVSLSGEGLIPPDISVSPSSLSESLFTGGSVTRTVTIANTGGSDLSFAVAIGNGAAITRSAASQLPAGTRSDVAPTTGIAAPMVVESRMAGADVLLLQDVAPWGTNSNQQVLAANGLAFDMIGSGSLAGTDLSHYRLLIVASDQPSSFYSALATQLNRIEAWVVSGGVLEFHAASMGWQDGDTSTLTLPRGMYVYQRHVDVNYVLDPTHPVVAGVSSVIYGTQASHTSFADIPADASLVVSDDMGQPNLVVYRDGLGLVVAGGQTFEFGLATGQDAGQILMNMIPYAHGQQPRWLVVDSPGGVVPAGGSVDLSVTFDAAGLEGGEYDAQIVVTSNDPDHPTIPVPTHLHVRCTGTPSQCAPVAVCSDVTIAADGNCLGHVAAESIGAGSHDPNGRPLTSRIDPAGPFALGATTVTLTVTNDDGASSTCLSTVIVADATAPELSVRLSPDTLWSPNHTMVGVDALPIMTDNCGSVSIVLTAVVSSEADNGVDDGDTINDISQVEPGTADFHFALRAERAGSGPGRIYTAFYEATDGAGNTRTATAHTVVPHDQGAVDPLDIRLDQTASGTRVSWTSTPAALTYDVVRGRLAAIREANVVVDLGPVACIARNAQGPSTPDRDPEIPARGELFFYLVEYDNGTSTSYGKGTTKPRVAGPGACD